MATGLFLLLTLRAGPGAFRAFLSQSASPVMILPSRVVASKVFCRVMEPPSQGPVPASSETLVASLSHTPLGIQLVSKGVDCRSMPTISKHRSSLDTLYVFMVSWPRVRSKQGLTMAKWTCRDPKPFPAGSLRQRAAIGGLPGYLGPLRSLPEPPEIDLEAQRQVSAAKAGPGS